MILDDATHLANFQNLEENLLKAMGAGIRKISLTLDVMAWLELVQEIKDRRPRNISRLIADDTTARLNAAIDRLDEEIAFLIVHGPADVSQRFDPNRKRHRRDLASAELRRSVKDAPK